jgi:hypothetical protein
MLTCQEFRAQLERGFNGDLDPVQEYRMQAHRKRCLSCNKEYGAMVERRFKERGPFDLDIRHPWQACLNEATLKEFLAGSLSQEEAKYVRSHTAECFSCHFQLERLENQEESRIA